ncbi:MULTISPECIES: DUF4136 domain-containing protein [Flavobacterium]|nr:DUF4136 domain-containing protein [Flavobacterium sp. N1846]
MRTLKLLSVALLFLLASCSSVRVNADYDKNANFGQYKTYAFHKSGIDKAEISDLDKKRILRSIDTQMSAKGFTKSDSPDLLVNIFTKERERVDVNQYYSGWGYGWGYGWNPYFWGGRQYVTTSTEGTLYIDLIDAKSKELIWQGVGTGYLTNCVEKKDERANEFVSKILEQFPPQIK